MQNRHWGIRYDAAVFTNLTPEHIEAHGGFDRYKLDKGKLFAAVSTRRPKTIDDKKIDTAIVVNADDEHADYFLNFSADKKYSYSLADALEIAYGISGTAFSAYGERFSMKLVGEFNVYNTLAALCVAKHFGVSMHEAKRRLEAVTGVPGRMELIDEGQPFTVLVDYAHDVESFEKLFSTLRLFKKNRIIHVFGSAGGVRDHAKRPALGAFSAAHADVTIVTDEDSYDEPVKKILNEIAAGAAGKTEGDTLFLIEDRAAAIAQACALARTGDLVLITGKGAEQNIKSNGRVTPWDDRTAARTALRTLNYGSSH